MWFYLAWFLDILELYQMLQLIVTLNEDSWWWTVDMTFQKIWRWGFCPVIKRELNLFKMVCTCRWSLLNPLHLLTKWYNLKCFFIFSAAVFSHLDDSCHDYTIFWLVRIGLKCFADFVSDLHCHLEVFIMNSMQTCNSVTFYFMKKLIFWN